MSHRVRSYRVLAGAAAVNLGLGTLYAWSVLAEPLQDSFGAARTDVSAVFSVALVTFCVTVVATGWLADRWQPSRLVTAAALFACAGVAGGALAPSLEWVVVGYGLLFGVGNGVGYATAIAVAGKVFARRRGLALGVVVGTYAASPLLASPLLERGIATLGWRSTLLALASALIVVMLAGSMLLRGVTDLYRLVPPAGAPSVTAPRPRDVVRSTRGWLLWAVMLLGSFPALMTLGHIAGVASLRGLSPTRAAFLVALVAVGNTGGRLSASALSDLVGRGTALPGTMVIAPVAAGLVAAVSGNAVLYPAALLIGGAYGALAALVPAATADLFGTPYFAGNFGVIFSAWGLAGVTGPFVGAVWLERPGGDVSAYAVAAAVALVGLLASLVLRRHLP